MNENSSNSTEYKLAKIAIALVTGAIGVALAAGVIDPDSAAMYQEAAITVVEQISLLVMTYIGGASVRKGAAALKGGNS